MRLQAEDDAITAQNDAIWGLIAPFLANQIARITIDFKMSIIKQVIAFINIGVFTTFRRFWSFFPKKFFEFTKSYKNTMYLLEMFVISLSSYAVVIMHISNLTSQCSHSY